MSFKLNNEGLVHQSLTAGIIECIKNKNKTPEPKPTDVSGLRVGSHIMKRTKQNLEEDGAKRKNSLQRNFHSGINLASGRIDVQLEYIETDQAPVLVNDNDRPQGETQTDPQAETPDKPQ